MDEGDIFELLGDDRCPGFAAACRTVGEHLFVGVALLEGVIDRTGAVEADVAAANVAVGLSLAIDGHIDVDCAHLGEDQRVAAERFRKRRLRDWRLDMHVRNG